MTGEITLQGRVLPVGGIKEKILAGVARGLKHVIIPSQNVKDLEEVPKELLKKIKVHPRTLMTMCWPWPSNPSKRRPRVPGKPLRPRKRNNAAVAPARR